MLPLIGMIAPAILGGASAGGLGLMGLGTTLGMELGKGLLSQLGQNLINDLLPNGPLKNTLNSAITGSLGPGITGSPQTTEGISDQISESLGSDPAETYQMVKDMEDLMKDFLMNFLEDNQRAEENQGSGSSKGKSWIQAMAEKLGEVLDKAWETAEASIDKVAAMGEASIETEEVTHTTESESSLLGISFGGSSSSTTTEELTDNAKFEESQMPAATAEMQGDIQQFSMIMSAATTAIKSAGEANNGMARKQ